MPGVNLSQNRKQSPQSIVYGSKEELIAKPQQNLRYSASFAHPDEVQDDEVYLRETVKPRIAEEKQEDRSLSVTVQKYTSDQDDIRLPISALVLPWNYFNVDFLSSQHDFTEVERLCEKFPDKKVDLRPYMIEEPFTCSTTDKLPKVLEMFRHFHLRALPVINPSNGLPVAVLTRQDLFAWMDL